MSRIAPVLAGLGGVLTVVAIGVMTPAYAGRPLPVDDPGSDQGIPSGFIFLFVLALLASIGVGIWKVSTARGMARQSGMDPDLATKMTLLSDDGLEATYLASSLRQTSVVPPPPPDATSAPAPEAAPTTAGRLTELRSLLDRGLVTQAEYDERRKAIIDTV